MPCIASVTALSARVTPNTVWTFARVRDEAGNEGWGEGSLQGRSEAVTARIDFFQNEFIGKAFTTPIDLGPAPADLPSAAALSAVDQALWDLASRSAGKPLAELLGGKRRDSVELYANINRGTADRSPAGFAARAAEAAELGFRAIKIAPFDGLTPGTCSFPDGKQLMKTGLARIAASADAIGKRSELQVDCHWRFDENAAAEALAECARLGVTWFECPLPEEPGNFAAIRRLRSKANSAGMRLAGAETFIGVEGFRPLLERGLYDVIMPDAKYAGGLAELMRIAALAEKHGVACSLHNPSGPICHAHSIHVSAALPGSERLEYQHGETPLFYSIAPGLQAPSQGRAKLPGPLRIELGELKS